MACVHPGVGATRDTDRCRNRELTTQCTPVSPSAPPPGAITRGHACSCFEGVNRVSRAHWPRTNVHTVSSWMTPSTTTGPSTRDRVSLSLRILALPPLDSVGCALDTNGQQLGCVFRRRSGGTDHETPVDGASVSQRKGPLPPAVFRLDLAIPVGPAVPFEVAVCWLRLWKLNEFAVDRSVAGFDLAGPESADGGRGDAKVLAGIGVT